MISMGRLAHLKTKKYYQDTDTVNTGLASYTVFVAVHSKLPGTYLSRVITESQLDTFLRLHVLKG